MKSKLEKKLDEEFERFGTKPKIYHFVEGNIHCTPFRAITVATVDNLLSWKRLDEIIDEYSLSLSRLTHSYATRMIHMLQANGIYGIAICDQRDQFNRQYGRVKAKGRLLQYLRH